MAVAASLSGTPTGLTLGKLTALASCPALGRNLVYTVTGGAFGPMPGGSGQVGPSSGLGHTHHVAQEHCVLGLADHGAC